MVGAVHLDSAMAREAQVITATRRLQWCCGHRVKGHEGKCRNPHGHNYVGYFHARETSHRRGPTKGLDQLGRVIDFGVLKERIGRWIDEHWDHGFVYLAGDAPVEDMLMAFDGAEGAVCKSYRLPTNPTAENLAAHLLNVVCPEVLAGTSVQVHKVVLWETENCFATVEL